VVGGGAIGAACARELALTGRRVLVLDAGGNLGQAWRAAGGMLAPQIEADATDPLLKFGIEARDHYSVLAPGLRETTGIDVGLWQEGIARVAVEPADAEVLRANVAWQQEQGYRCEWLAGAEVHRRWPWLSPVAGALWAPSDGALDPIRLVEALLQDAVRLGATVITDRVTHIERQGDVIRGVSSDVDHYAAPEVVIAAGAWSPLIQGLPRLLPVEPVRGQMAALRWPAGVPPAIIYQKESYILARGSEAVLGSTMERVGFQPDVTPAGLAQIFSATGPLAPALARSKIQRSWAGLRPMTPDALPIIGREPEVRGLWYATGHGRNGILLAGLTGKLLAKLIDGAGSARELLFAVERFRDAK
jgi:glycine oxidase